MNGRHGADLRPPPAPRALLKSDRRPRDPVSFHARHKMRPPAHHPAAYRQAGLVVAQADTR
ncbi:hypothetical protein ABT061_47740 [Streptosporangium sp. NPDC002544]|uniref:hypothetical protein n=1 Tax=Streptosporangium sp. NPDC002544 TaxID=3154538 RepID=UPI00331701F3